MRIILNTFYLHLKNTTDDLLELRKIRFNETCQKEKHAAII